MFKRLKNLEKRLEARERKLDFLERKVLRLERANRAHQRRLKANYSLKELLEQGYTVEMPTQLYIEHLSLKIRMVNGVPIGFCGQSHLSEKETQDYYSLYKNYFTVI